MNLNGLFIGIDYVGTSSRLAGCRADARSWRGRESGIDLPNELAATPGELCQSALVLLEEKATKRQMVSCIQALAAKCRKGSDDYFLITYSGHGTYRRGNDPHEVDGNDEAICCYDFLQGGLLWDNEISVLLSGAQGLFITDCCHSKTLLRSAYEIRPRFLPFDEIIDGLSACEVNKICEVADTYRPLGRSLRDASGAIPGIIHLAGCKDNEFSYDANFGGKPNGAMTYFALEAYRSLGRGATFAHWIREIQSRLPDKLGRYPQNPQLTCTVEDEARVLFGRELPVANPPPPPATQPTVKEVAQGVTSAGRPFRLELG